MIPLAFVVAIALATVAVLVITAMSLVRQARRMAESVTRFRDEMEPALREIRAGTERATERLDRLQRPEGREGAGGAPAASTNPDGPAPR